MAKTRIKTTPTRMQKEALMASEVVSTTTTANAVTAHVLKKRISVLKNSLTAKEKSLPIPSTIIVQPPKRTNSISSTTSTISYTSDGTHSCTDSPPPSHISEAAAPGNGPTMDELTASAIKTLNAGFLAKSNARLLKNRKVYMITEKCDDNPNAMHNGENGNVVDNGIAAGQKRKMFLIMEEDENDKNNEKQMKVESFAPKKLTLYTNTSDGQLPQEFEKVLPEILNRIQSNKGVKKIVEDFKGNTEIVETPEPKAAQMSLLKINNNSKLQTKSESPERLPLTLPPKKNRTKIITTQIIPVNSSQPLSVYPANGIENWAATNSDVVASVAAAPGVVTTNISNGFYKAEKSCGATPVIVNASSLLATNGNGSLPSVNGLKSKENCSGNKTTTVNQLHKNINLSTDFLFLMKMLPKLESIEEPHKNYVKTYIEDIINQYAPQQIEQQ